MQFDCFTCSTNKDMPDFYGCKIIKDDPIYATQEEIYYSCPRNWLLENVLTWFYEYEHDCKFNVPKTFDEISCRYVDAYRMYESYVYEFETKKGQRRNSNTSLHHLKGVYDNAQNHNR